MILKAGLHGDLVISHGELGRGERDRFVEPDPLGTLLNYDLVARVVVVVVVGVGVGVGRDKREVGARLMPVGIRGGFAMQGPNGIQHAREHVDGYGAVPDLCVVRREVCRHVEGSRGEGSGAGS